jgi:N-carbamoylputrescine amidase
VKVAGIQLTVSRETREENLQKAEHYVGQAADEGAELICLQEYFSTGSFTREITPEHFRYAETIHGETIQRMAAIAKEKGVWLVIPLFEQDEKVHGRYYNSAIVLDRKGQIGGRYRKQMLAENRAFEKYFFVPGNLGTPVFHTEELTFGITICYDRHYFEIPRILVLRGAHLIFVPAATYKAKGRGDIWQPELVSMAANNGVYVVGVDATGYTDGRDHLGQSLIIDPYGTRIAYLEEGDGYVLADVSPEVVRAARDRYPLIRDFRPDLLDELASLYKG